MSTDMMLNIMTIAAVIVAPILLKLAVDDGTWHPFREIKMIRRKFVRTYIRSGNGSD
jgi:hypothetical protein